MTNPAVVEKLVLKDILAECREDFVEVWSVLWLVRYQLCDGAYPLHVYERTDPAEVRQVALAVIKGALECGVRAVFYADGVGQASPVWNRPTEEVLARLEAEWNKLGREPSIGELAGFTSYPGIVDGISVSGTSVTQL